MMTCSLKRQRQNPFEMLRLIKVLTFSCMLLAATVLGDDSEVHNGECESSNEGNDPGQCLAVTNANSSDEVEEEDAPTANSSKGDSPWYRNLTDCKDNHRKCDFWAGKNECAGNPERMLQLCPKACNVCDNVSDGYVANCYGEDQHVAGSREEEVAVRVREVEEYMLTEVFVEEKYAKIRSECKNRDKECSFWAVIGGKKLIGAGMMHGVAISRKRFSNIQFGQWIICLRYAHILNAFSNHRMRS
jgi:hypothetical protein